jgi:hypothetical protein
MYDERLDDIRGGVLRQMERADRAIKLAIGAAALLELGLLSLVVFTADLRNPVERLIFLTSILSYAIIALGLVALGGHVTRSVGRLASLLDSGARSR